MTLSTSLNPLKNTYYNIVDTVLRINDKNNYINKKKSQYSIGPPIYYKKQPNNISSFKLLGFSICNV